MPNSIMYQEDGFVVLETNQPEQFLTAEELLEKLKVILQSLGEELPRELQKFNSLEAQAKYLMNTFCELDLGPGQYLQWYVVRWTTE
jgi:Protein CHLORORESPIRATORY REDUCTION 7